MAEIRTDGLEAALAYHAARYPRMEPRDAVKLVYQNEFGGGHLLRDPAGSLEALRAEWAALSRDREPPLLEDVGDGMCRVDLAALEEGELEDLERDFVSSAARHAGDQGRFLEKLEILRALAGEGMFSFSRAELERYLQEHISAGCPAVSHSAGYRTAYRPAYRVVARRFSRLALIGEIRALLETRPRVLVALDGRCASGKTTWAAQLQARYGWQVVHMDHFFLRPEQRTPERYAEPGGNVDRERVWEEVLRPLREGRAAVYRPFDCAREVLGEPVRAEPGPVTVVEGAYACHPALWDSYDLHVCMTVGPEEQLRRIAARNGTEGAERFRARWIPLEERYLSALRVEERCTFLLDG